MAFNPNNPNGRAAASGSQPLVLSTEDKYVLDDIASKIDIIRGDTLNLDEPLTTLDANIRTQLATLEGGLKGASSKTLTDLYNRLIAAPATEAKQDTIITHLLSMLAEMRDDVFVTAIYWEDRSSATAVFYREERIRSQDDGNVTTVYTRLSDNTVVGSLPPGVILVQGANDRTIEAFRYKAIASGTGYSSGDWLTNTLVYDTDGNGSVISSTWYNLSTAASISAPSGSNIQAENEAVLASIVSILTATYTPITETRDAIIGSVAPSIGNTNDAAAGSDTGTFSLISLFKRLLQGITTIFGNQTNGTQKSINRGAAKGTTTAGDVTSTDAGSNRQLLDVAVRDSSGNQINTFGGGGGSSDTLTDTLIELMAIIINRSARIDGSQRQVVYLDNLNASANSLPVNLNASSAIVGISFGTTGNAAPLPSQFSLMSAHYIYDRITVS